MIIDKGCHPHNRRKRVRPEIVQRDMGDSLQRFLERGIVIHGAQRAPGLFSYVQNDRDEYKTLGTVILNGSPHLLLLKQIAQSLAGRIATLLNASVLANELGMDHKTLGA